MCEKPKEEIDNSDVFQKKRWRGTPLYDWYDGKLLFTGIEIPTETGKKIITGMQLRKQMFGEYVGDWSKAWKSIHAEVNGQVKNYLVALRTLAPAPKGKYKIWVRGSKMSQKSGLWHQYFAEYVARYYEGSTIVFNDMAEYAIVKPIEGVEIKYELSPNPKLECDVLIDDAHTPEGVLPAITNAKYYSLKQRGTEQFLIRETRLFSHTLETQVKKVCPCAVCEQISDISNTYEAYMKLICDVQALGYVQCITYLQKSNYISSEMKAVDKLQRDILTVGQAVVDQPILERAALRLKSVLNLELQGITLKEAKSINEDLLPVGWKKVFSYTFSSAVCGHIKDCVCDIIVTHTQGQVKVKHVADMTQAVAKVMEDLPWVERMEDDCPLIRGRSVQFVGVSSDFFNTTKLGRGNFDVTVLGDIEDISIYQTPYIFMNKQKILGYQQTGFKWKDKYLFVRKENVEHKHIIHKLGEVKTMVLLNLETYNPGTKVIETFPLGRYKGQGWKIKRKGEAQLYIGVDNRGNYCYKGQAQLQMVEGMLEKTFYHFLRGIVVEKKTIRWRYEKESQWNRVIGYYRRGVVVGCLTRFLKLPPEVFYVINQFLVG